MNDHNNEYKVGDLVILDRDIVALDPNLTKGSLARVVKIHSEFIVQCRLTSKTLKRKRQNFGVENKHVKRV